eukprot:TRINITY_DN3465_c0_g1_i16.p1 TRINITY_DN3465_c0_g1~~TRINITY_DN3465_c0_g1_i16.p1  ORF type:complete len:309 (-),score=-0.34 TRINITY_DN3465_c0_g1_i16:40-966(-)
MLIRKPSVLLKCSMCNVSVSSVRKINKQSSGEYCLQLVRKTDFEHYLTNLFLPDSLRRHAFAIRAFSAEISGVRDIVSDRTIGQMRMQFWKDTVESIYNDKVPQHPVAIELHAMISQHPNVSKLLLNRIIESREQFLADRPFNSLEEVDAYGKGAFSSVYLLLLEIMNNDCGHLKHAAAALGKCEGLITLLRGTPYNASQRRVYLPTNMLMERNLSSQNVIRDGHENEDLREVFEIIAHRAEEHLNSARLRKKYIKRDGAKVLLPALVADSYLDALSKVKCNVFDPKLTVRNSMLPLHLWIYRFRGKY